MKPTKYRRPGWVRESWRLSAKYQCFSQDCSGLPRSRPRVGSYLVGMEGAEPALDVGGIPARDQAAALKGT